MITLVYLVSGIIFGVGLSVSGMIDPLKVKSFLDITSTAWDPSLMFVLGAAVPVYFLAFVFLNRRKSTFNGLTFVRPQPRPIDRNLILGSIIFGIGWGLAGICPGPALVHLAFLDLSFAGFIVSMVIGFELQKRLA